MLKKLLFPYLFVAFLFAEQKTVDDLLSSMQAAKEEEEPSKKAKIVKRIKTQLRHASSEEIDQVEAHIDTYFQTHEFSLSTQKIYDVIIVGAGVHSTIALFTIKQIDPTLSVLVISPSRIPGGNYQQTGSIYYLNSPDYTFLKTNTLVNCLFQNLDIAPPGYSEGSTLAKALKFNLYLHRDFLIGQSITELTTHLEKSQVPYLLKTDQGIILCARSVVIATGLAKEHPFYGDLDKSSLALIHSEEKSELSETPPCLEHYVHFCRRIKARINNPSLCRAPLADYLGKRIALIGGGGAAGTVVEAFYGLGPAALYRSKCDSVLGEKKGEVGIQSIDWYVTKTHCLQEFDHIFKGRFQTSLLAHQIPVQIKTRRIAKIELIPSQNQEKCVRLFDDQGNYADYDYAIFATGYTSDIGIAQYVIAQNQILYYDSLRTIPLFDRESNTWIASTIEDIGGTFPKAIIVGPAAGIEISQQELDNATGSSNTSIELFAMRTAKVVSQLVMSP